PTLGVRWLSMRSCSTLLARMQLFITLLENARSPVRHFSFQRRPRDEPTRDFRHRPVPIFGELRDEWPPCTKNEVGPLTAENSGRDPTRRPRLRHPANNGRALSVCWIWARSREAQDLSVLEQRSEQAQRASDLQAQVRSSRWAP